MSHRFDPAILREYDVRGTTGENLGEADARAVGRSFGTRVRRAGGRSVVVGRDGRLSSPMLEAALVEGLTAAGCDVVRIGIGPSPMLYFAEATLAVDAGVQVTGSHNPRNDNGFKLVLRHDSFFGDDVRDLARLAAAGDWEEGAGMVTQADVAPAYVDRLLGAAPARGFRVAWDAGNGAAGPIVERLTRHLPGEHRLLFTEVDGCFPHHHPDPSVEANLARLKEEVSRHDLDLGIAFDGDGDRIGAVDAKGRAIRGDEMLAILAAPALAQHPGATIVADVKASPLLFDRIAALGGEPFMWKTGHSHMKMKMKELGAPLAGEMSGHMFMGGDYYGYDDAIYAAMKLLTAIDRAGVSLTAMRDAMPERATMDEQRVPVADDRKEGVVEEILARLRADGAQVDTTDGARVTTADGWYLLRASNTQAALTVQAEARDAAGLERLVSALDDRLAAVGLARR